MAAQTLEKRVHGLDQRVHAAAREPDTSLALQVRHDRVDRAGAKRIAADEQRVEAEDRAQVRVAKEARNEAVHTLCSIQTQQFGQELQKRRQLVEWLAREVFEGALIDVPRGRHEACVAIHGIGIERAHLCLDLFRRAAVIEMPAIGEVDAVIRRERYQLEVSLEACTGARPQVVQQVRCGDDARPHVEGVAGALQLAGSPADLRTLFDQRDRVSRCLQPDRRRKSAETRAHDDHFGAAHRFTSGNRTAVTERGRNGLTAPVHVGCRNSIAQRIASATLKRDEVAARRVNTS